MASDRSRSGREKVGYGRPPAKTRWKKGQSGNPKGRPKGSLSFNTLLAKALERKVLVTKNGRTQKMTCREAAVEAVIGLALKGDVKMLDRIFQIDFEQPKTNLTANEIAEMDPNSAAETYLRLVRAAAPTNRLR